MNIKTTAGKYLVSTVVLPTGGFETIVFTGEAAKRTEVEMLRHDSAASAVLQHAAMIAKYVRVDL